MEPNEPTNPEPTTNPANPSGINEALIRRYVTEGNADALVSLFSFFRQTLQRVEAERDTFMHNMLKMSQARSLNHAQAGQLVEARTGRAMPKLETEGGRNPAEPSAAKPPVTAAKPSPTKPSLSSVVEGIEL